MGFLVEKAKSLISKKVGAAIITGTAAAGGAPEGVVWAGIAYILAQAIVDCFKYWVDSQS
jgi:hypothetical protein